MKRISCGSTVNTRKVKEKGNRVSFSFLFWWRESAFHMVLNSVILSHRFDRFNYPIYMWKFLTVIMPFLFGEELKIEWNNKKRESKKRPHCTKLWTWQCDFVGNWIDWYLSIPYETMSHQHLVHNVLQIFGFVGWKKMLNLFCLIFGRAFLGSLKEYVM